MKCSMCECDLSGTRHVEKRWNIRCFRVEAFCPACWANLDEFCRPHPLWLQLVGLVSVVIVVAGSGQPLHVELIGLILMTVLLYLCIVIHELGHAIAGWLLGYEVLKVQVGFGHRLWRFDLNGTIFEFNLWPSMGYAHVTKKKDERSPLKDILVLLAGPLAHFSVFAPYLSYSQIGGFHITVEQSSLSVIKAFVDLNVGLFILNLMPFKFSDRGLPVCTDGLGIWNVFFARAEKKPFFRGMYLFSKGLVASEQRNYQEAERLYAEAVRLYPNNELMKVNLAFAKIELAKYSEARTILEGLLRAECLDNSTRAIVWNNLAFADIFLEDKDLLDQALHFSGKAAKQLPKMPCVLSTRGSVMIAAGDIGGGSGFVAESLRARTSEPAKAHGLLFLALAEHKRGNALKREHYLHASERLDPDCSSRGWIIRQIAKAS